MKAVIYHAPAKTLWHTPPNLYKRLFEGFKEQAHKHGVSLIHLTLTGCEGWGDENIYYTGLDAQNVVYNREVCFTKFLENAPDDVYWLTEPDARLMQMFPWPKADLTMLYRDDDVHMTPSFRIARKSSLPIFQELLSSFKGEKDWHGDSRTFNLMYERMGSPKIGFMQYKGLQVEFRDYRDYGLKHSKYVTHHKFISKMQLL